MSFEEKLIEKVKENDFLYNTKSKLYKNIIKREFVWSQIAESLESSSKLKKNIICFPTM